MNKGTWVALAGAGTALLVAANASKIPVVSTVVSSDSLKTPLLGVPIGSLVVGLAAAFGVVYALK
jgi:hypothetical protein